MYSDDEDSDVEINTRGLQAVAIRQSDPSSNAGGQSGSETASPTASKPTPSPPANALKKPTIDKASQVNEDAALPESILSRCAVLLDATMLGSAGIQPARTGTIVEMAYRVVMFPLSAEHYTVARHACGLWEPHTSAANMNRRDKNIMIDDVQHRVMKLHGIASFYHGVGDNNTRPNESSTLRAYFDDTRQQPAVKESETITMEVANSYDKHTMSRVAMKAWIKVMCDQATAWCRAAKKEEVIAFVTLKGESREEVERALTFAQVELGVQMPKYRIFVLEDVVYGPDNEKEWNAYSDADRSWDRYACPYHRRVALQEHGYRYRCCKWSVCFMARILEYATEMLEKVSESSVNWGQATDAVFVTDE